MKYPKVRAHMLFTSISEINAVLIFTRDFGILTNSKMKTETFLMAMRLDEFMHGFLSFFLFFIELTQVIGVHWSN